MTETFHVSRETEGDGVVDQLGVSVQAGDMLSILAVCEYKRFGYARGEHVL